MTYVLYNEGKIILRNTLGKIWCWEQLVKYDSLLYNMGAVILPRLRTTGGIHYSEKRPQIISRN